MAFLGILLKDIKLRLLDKRSMIVNLTLPILLASLFGYIFAPERQEARQPTLVVVLQDDSDATRALLKRLEDSGTLRLEYSSEAEARQAIESGRRKLALVMPAGLGQQLSLQGLFSPQPMPLPLLTDPTASAEAQMVEGRLTQAILALLADEFAQPDKARAQLQQARSFVAALADDEAGRQAWDRFLAKADEALALMPPLPQGRQAELRPPVKLRRQAVTATGEDFNSYSHSFAGMLVMYLFFVATDGGLAIVDERQRGTWQRLRALPMARMWLLLSKMLVTFLQALFVALIVYAFGALVFDVAVQGSVLGFAGLLICGAACAAGFSMMLMGIGRSIHQVMGVGVFFVLVMSFLGGAWFPVWMMPDWLKAVGLGVPMRWAMDGLHAVTWRGLGLEQALAPMGMLLLFGLIFTGIGLKTFRWRD